MVKNGYYRKNNCQIAKLVYIYEDVVPEASKSRRHKLVNQYYFCRVCSGEDNLKFWREVYTYVDNHYELSKVKRIYVNGDGGSWILSGMNELSGITYVLDAFHLEKYLTKLTSHMLDSSEDTKEELKKQLRWGTKADFKAKVEELMGYLKSETGKKRMEEAEEYILSNWSVAVVRLRKKEGVKRCIKDVPTEGVLSKWRKYAGDGKIPEERTAESGRNRVRTDQRRDGVAFRKEPSRRAGKVYRSNQPPCKCGYKEKSVFQRVYMGIVSPQRGLDLLMPKEPERMNQSRTKP